MTDINASLKKTINNQPGPQYKEKGKAEFNFSEGEDGKPYSYDRDVEAKLEELKTTNESRLTAIENKLDSVIENGSINTQLTGSNVEQDVILKDRNVKRIDILESLALTDTSIFQSSVINISEFKKFLIFVRNTHDVEVQLVFTPGQVNSFYWSNNTWKTRQSSEGTVVIPPSQGADLYNITDFFTEYNNSGFLVVQVRGRANSEPSKGSIECFVWGVPN